MSLLEFIRRPDLWGSVIALGAVFVLVLVLGRLEDKYPDHDPRDDE